MLITALDHMVTTNKKHNHANVEKKLLFFENHSHVYIHV